MAITEVFKWLDNGNREHLLGLLNICWNQEFFPDEALAANVASVLKKGDTKKLVVRCANAVVQAKWNQRPVHWKVRGFRTGSKTMGRTRRRRLRLLRQMGLSMWIQPGCSREHPSPVQNRGSRT